MVVVKKPSANAGDIRDVGSIPDLGRSPGGGNGDPLQYSCLENPRDRGPQGATVHGVAKSWTGLKCCSSSDNNQKCAIQYQTGVIVKKTAQQNTVNFRSSVYLYILKSIGMGNTCKSMANSC